ncbi:MAG: hypothetical protein GX236_02810 [Clostridiaceae bacterium]|nr:hypothetical protein [Clostridiaceae bacterium]
MNFKLVLIRDEHLKDRTLGRLIVFREGIKYGNFYTLELPWRDNAKNISRIPEGVYKVRKRYSQRFGNHFEVLGVPDRTLILIHKGNFPEDTDGCILPGLSLVDIGTKSRPGDGIKEVAYSGVAMKELNRLITEEEAEIIIC